MICKVQIRARIGCAKVSLADSVFFAIPAQYVQMDEPHCALCMVLPFVMAYSIYYHTYLGTCWMLKSVQSLVLYIMLDIVFWGGDAEIHHYCDAQTRRLH